MATFRINLIALLKKFAVSGKFECMNVVFCVVIWAILKSKWMTLNDLLNRFPSNAHSAYAPCVSQNTSECNRPVLQGARGISGNVTSSSV